MGENGYVSIEDAKGQVRQMGTMTAALYYHLAKEIIAELGEERGSALLARAIQNYGAERGAQQKERILAANIEHSPENYAALPDLPSLGWEVQQVEPGENKTHIRITYCPFAEYWKERDFCKIGRLYCAVDQAKYTAYHPESHYVHLKHALEGAEFCEMVCRHRY